MPIWRRGWELDYRFGHKVLHPDNPTIDDWDKATGTVTSHKSVDLDAPSYQVEGAYANSLYNTINRAIESLAEYSGGEYAGVEVPEDKIMSRTLTVIVPSPGTPSQQKVLQLLEKAGRQRGVNVKVEVSR